jgi:hypothetical protein
MLLQQQLARPLVLHQRSGRPQRKAGHGLQAVGGQQARAQKDNHHQSCSPERHACSPCSSEAKTFALTIDQPNGEKVERLG